MDNTFEDVHEEICDHEKGKEEEDSISCKVLNVNKREYYSLSWEEIAEAANQDEFLVDLMDAMLKNNYEKLEVLLKNKKIHDEFSPNGLSAIQIQDLSIYRNVIMVRDRIWAPIALSYGCPATGRACLRI